MCRDDFKCLNDYFDHIYVLTLDRATKRQKTIAQVLDGLNWSFFYGIDKKDLNLSELKAKDEYDESAHKSTKRTHRGMSLGEVACAMSHREIHKDVIDKGYERVLIFEDDVVPVYEKLSHFSPIVGELPSDWDILMLGYYSEKKPSLKYMIQIWIYLLYHHLKLFNWHNMSKAQIKELSLKDYSGNLYTIGKVLGAHAYAISNNAAKAFVDFQSPVVIQADRLFNYAKLPNNLKGFAAKVKLFNLHENAKESFIGYGKTPK